MADNPGQFKPGNSPHPGGRRPPEYKQFREFLRTYSDEAAQELIDRALGRPDPATGQRNRDTASEAALWKMLAYLYGNPPQSVAGEGGEGPAVIEIVRRIIDPRNSDTAGVSALPEA